MNNEITKLEQTELKECELTIELAQGAFVACGKAIAKIRDSKLYRSEYSTFEEYCKKRWGWSDRRAYQLIEASEFVSDLPKSERSEIKTERQARSLINGKSDDLNQKPEPVVRKIINLDKTGFPIPDSLMEDWNRATDVGRDCLHRASQLKCMIDDGKKDDVIWAEVTQSAIAYAQNLHSFLKSLVPHAVCTSCQGRNPSKCATCKGRGFISEHYYDNAIPAEIKEIRNKSLAK